MSYAVISDIYANPEALQAVLRSKDSLDADFGRVECPSRWGKSKDNYKLSIKYG